MTTGKYPSLEDIYAEVDQFVESHAAVARAESLGTSEEGREVRAVTVTDPTVPAAEKEVALVVCGRHGDEMGTRGVGPAVLEWLASDEAAETRRRQTVIVVPVANPDGCAREEFLAPDDGLSAVEERTIGELARAVQPDLVADVHSMWGYDAEVVIQAHTTDCGEDAFIHGAMAARLMEDTARAGYPFVTQRLAHGYNNFFGGMCYAEFHSLVFGLEVNHLSLTADEAAESGAAAVRSLLGWGNARAPWEPRPGYPNRLLAGNFFTSIRPTGADAAERRRSRSLIWQNREGFAAPKRERPDPHTLRVTTGYSGAPLPCRFALCCRLRGFGTLTAVRLNGEEVEAETWEDACSTYLGVEVEPTPGRERTLTVTL